MKTVNVVAAIIKREDRILATQRGYGEFEGGWEFPGGKIEEGETQPEALEREIREELDAVIEVGDHLTHVSYSYENFHLEMDCFVCTLVGDSFILKEHHEAKWLDRASLDSVAWLAADLDVIAQIKQQGVI